MAWFSLSHWGAFLLRADLVHWSKLIDLADATGASRPSWAHYIDLAINDLRNSNRSPFDQRAYDVLRTAFGHEP